MKVASSIKRLCKNCRLVRRKNINFILCKINSKHKQRQG